MAVTVQSIETPDQIWKPLHALVNPFKRFDYIGINEMLFTKVPQASFWYGEGEHQYLAQKRG